MPLRAGLTSGRTRSEIPKGTGNNSMFGKGQMRLVANGGDDGQGKVRMVKATLLKSQSAAIYIAILAKATVTPGPDDDSGLMSWPPVSQPIRCASRRGV